MSDGKDRVKGRGLLAAFDPQDSADPQASKLTEFVGSKAMFFAVPFDGGPKLA